VLMGVLLNKKRAGIRARPGDVFRPTAQGYSNLGALFRQGGVAITARLGLQALPTGRSATRLMKMKINNIAP